MASAEDTPVLEGFICSICKSDRGTIENLVTHFQNEHSEEQDLIKSFKDLLDIAKKKILKQDNFSSSIYETPRHSSSSFEFVFEPQEIGVTFLHTALFKTVREDRIERHEVATNQLYIRMEKLVDNIPTDPKKRRAHEQNIVHWIDGTDVNRCPICTDPFTLVWRQHHCRFCGMVLCNVCGLMVSVKTIRTFLEPQVELVEPMVMPVAPAVGPVEQLPNPSNDIFLRMCPYCSEMIETREFKKRKHLKPTITRLYEQLAIDRKESEKLNAEYTKMANSLSSGETIYSLKEAQIAKVRLLRLFENIDLLSSKIAVLKPNVSAPVDGKAARLVNMVRYSCSMYLREQALNLPNLPNDEELEQIQRRRREKITAEIHEEKMKREAKLSHSTSHQKPSTSPSRASTAVADQQLSLGQGWVPETNKKVNELEDPLIEQMNIIRIYIKEAKMAQKFDEVASLEENLQELKKEFYRKQQIQDDLVSQSGESSEAASLSSYD